VTCGTKKERRQRQSPGYEISGALRRPSPISRACFVILEAAAFPVTTGNKVRWFRSAQAAAEKDEGVAILDYALDNRPSTGRGKWAAGCFPNAPGVSWFLSRKQSGPANYPERPRDVGTSERSGGRPSRSPVSMKMEPKNWRAAWPAKKMPDRICVGGRPGKVEMSPSRGKAQTLTRESYMNLTGHPAARMNGPHSRSMTNRNNRTMRTPRQISQSRRNLRRKGNNLRRKGNGRTTGLRIWAGWRLPARHGLGNLVGQPQPAQAAHEARGHECRDSRSMPVGLHAGLGARSEGAALF